MIEPGSPISIMSGGTAEALPVRATVMSESDRCLRVQVAPPAPESFPAVAIAVVGQGSRQRYARVDVTRMSLTDWSLRVALPWQRPLDQRREPRYPAHIPAGIQRKVQPGGLEARVLDVSHGGAAVQVASWDEEDAFDLTIEWPGTPVYGHCRVVGVECRWNGIVLHCGFDDMSAPQLVALDELVTSLRASFEAAQRYLAVRIDDP